MVVRRWLRGLGVGMAETAGRTVLILEDELLIALDVEHEMNRAGYEVGAVLASCDAAKVWLADNHADFAILDIELADGSCAEVAGTLKDRGIPFVIYSGSDVVPFETPAVFLNGPWVSKPARPEDLVAAIEALEIRIHDGP